MLPLKPALDFVEVSRDGYPLLVALRALQPFVAAVDLRLPLDLWRGPAHETVGDSHGAAVHTQQHHGLASKPGATPPIVRGLLWLDTSRDAGLGG